MRTKLLIAALALAITGLANVPAALSATQSVTANIRFDTPLNLNKTADIDFGSVTAANASTYRISTAGAVSTVAGTGSYLTGTTQAASITISGSGSQTLNISVGGYTAQGGVTPSNARCAYDGGGEQACSYAAAAAPAAGKVLLVGADVAADGSQVAGATATPTFTVTVVYN